MAIAATTDEPPVNGANSNPPKTDPKVTPSDECVLPSHKS
jgi:hypothetical protein